MAIYVKYDGIDGEVTQQGHEKWIEVHSFQFGVGRGISTPVGSAKNRESSAPSVSEVVITKEMDSASTELFKQSTAGADGKKVEIVFFSTGDPGTTYAQYTLEDTLISGYSVSSGSDRPIESISLNFTKVMFEMTSHDDKNKAESPIRVSYDLATAKSG
jgi:type VI secretion system secreted protein Hcp